MKSAKVILAVIILVFISSGEAFAQARADSTATGPEPAVIDTLMAAADSADIDTLIESDAPKPRLFTPTWKVTSSAGMSTVSLGSNMNVDIRPGGGWIAKSTIDVGEKINRTRNMVDLNESFKNSATKIEPGLYTLSFNVGKDYKKSKTVSLSRFGKDIVFENEGAEAAFSYHKSILKSTASIFSVNGNYARGQQDFKYNRKMSGNASGHISYDIGRNFTFGGGYGTYMSREGSEIGPIEFNNIPSRSDTFKVNAGYNKSSDDFLTVRYELKSGDIKRVDPPRGNALEILDNPELAKREEINQKGEVLNIHSGFKPASYVTLDIEFNRSLSDDQYDVDKRLSKKQERNKLKAKTVYEFSETGSATFDFEKTSSDMDYGFNSVSSFTEDENKIGFRVSQDLGKDWGISADGRMSLSQKYYKRYDDNPRDVDRLYYGGGAKMSSKPFKNVDASVEVKASRYEVRNIDVSLSSDNNVEYIYRLIPEFSVKPFGWLSLSQAYEVKMEYTEFSFDENKNYLDRTTIMNTKADIIIQGGISFGFDHKYDMRDTGSYLTVGNEKHYNRTSENFKHQMRLNVDYSVTEYLDLFSSALFHIRKNNRLAVENGKRVVTKSTLYDSGKLKIGFKGKKDISESGNMDLNVAYVRNYGYRISDAMLKFWEVKMNLVFGF